LVAPRQPDERALHVGFSGSSVSLRSRPIDTHLLKLLRPLCQPSPALGALPGERGGIGDLIDRVCCEFLSAQSSIWRAAGPRWGLHGEPKLDQSAGRL
jgi:hypothetical protein